MRPICFRRLGILIFCLLATVLNGCFGTSQPSRFYALSSLRGPEPIPHAASAGLSTLVAVGPVAIPDYLNRPEIVTRSGKNEMRVNEFQRWAGDLQANMLNTVIEDLSVLLPPDRLSVIRWFPAGQHDMSVTYRVMVDVMRFDAVPGGSVFIEADWAIYGKEKTIVLAKKSSISGTVGGAEFTDLVAAMSKAVEDLSREIAAGVMSLDQKTAEK